MAKSDSREMVISVDIPKKFKVGNVSVELKNELKGKAINCYDTSYFKDYNSSIIIEIDLVRSRQVKTLVKKKILEIYKKGIEDKRNLTPSELNVFYLVKDVTVKSEENRVFLIGYKNNSISSIKSTVLKFNVDCDYVELPRNMELYQDDKWDHLYNAIVDKVIHRQYNRFIIDITNLFINTTYDNTKKVVEYIESVQGRILFLVPKMEGCSKDRFIKIFGEKYIDCVMDKNSFIYTEYDSTIIPKIGKILEL